MMNTITSRIGDRCWIFIALSVFILLVFIILGSIGTPTYVNARRDQEKYNASTECLLLNKSVSTGICPTADQDCPLYICYDETFDVSYAIFNATKITSTIKTQQARNQRNVQVKNIRRKMIASYA